MVCEWKTNEVIGHDTHENVTEHLHRTARYHRGHLHQALAENVPSGIIHLGKKPVAIDIDPGQGVTLKFQDGSTATADLLLGADGLRSVSLIFNFLLRYYHLLICTKGGETSTRSRLQAQMEWADCVPCNL